MLVISMLAAIAIIHAGAFIALGRSNRPKVG